MTAHVCCWWRFSHAVRTAERHDSPDTDYIDSADAPGLVSEQSFWYNTGGNHGSLEAEVRACVLRVTISVHSNRACCCGRELYLGQNLLSGTVPSVMSRMTALVKLHLFKNAVSDWVLPRNVLPLISRFLSVHRVVQLTGTVPESWSALRVLELFLYENQFVGTLYSSWGAKLDYYW